MTKTYRYKRRLPEQVNAAQVTGIDSHPNIVADDHFPSKMALITNETNDGGKSYGITEKSYKLQVHIGDFIVSRDDGFMYLYSEREFFSNFEENFEEVLGDK